MKGLVLKALFSRWPRPRPLEDGYTILLPSPMDMPFLLRYALEGLVGMDTEPLPPDPRGPRRLGGRPGGGPATGRRRVRRPPGRTGRLSSFDYLIVRLMGKTGSAPHWKAILSGTERARCEYIFLHDADAFFVERDALERQYRECRDRGMYTLGVTPRWDPFFEEARLRHPGDLGDDVFDPLGAEPVTPLLEGALVARPPTAPMNSIRCSTPSSWIIPRAGSASWTPPPRWSTSAGRSSPIDAIPIEAASPWSTNSSVLLLAILEDLMPAANGVRVLPTVASLARGLDHDDAPVVYNSE